MLQYVLTNCFAPTHSPGESPSSRTFFILAAGIHTHKWFTDSMVVQILISIMYSTFGFSLCRDEMVVIMLASRRERSTYINPPSSLLTQNKGSKKNPFLHTPVGSYRPFNRLSLSRLTPNTSSGRSSPVAQRSGTPRSRPVLRVLALRT
jgi:hypothetical protein